MKENGNLLWRVPVGTEFEDFMGKQRFIKEAEVITPRGEKRHQIRCLHSPFTKMPGPVCAAFFCCIGDVIFREGSLRVYPVGSDPKVGLRTEVAA